MNTIKQLVVFLFVFFISQRVFVPSSPKISLSKRPPITTAFSGGTGPSAGHPGLVCLCDVGFNGEMWGEKTLSNDKLTGFF